MHQAMVNKAAWPFINFVFYFCFPSELLDAILFLDSEFLRN